MKKLFASITVNQRFQARCQAIASDWQSVQREVLSVRRREKDDLFQQKTTAQRSIDRLRSSQSPTVIATEEVKNHTQPLAGGFYASLVEVGDGESSLRVRASTTVANGSPSMKSRVEITRKKFNQMIHLEVCLELTSHQLRE